MGRYLKRLYRLLAMPEDGLSVGLMRPADSPVLVRELAKMRLRELTQAGGISGLLPAARAAIAGRLFHTWEDFLLEEKQGRPGRADHIGYGHSLGRDSRDAAGYLAYVAGKDEGLARFLFREFEAKIGYEAFDTSVYITGETKSGKSYLSQLLAYRLADREKSSVWVLDPHGALARACAEWNKILTIPNTYYFDVNLSREGGHDRPLRPKFNPFDQLPDKSPATLDIVTQEQVNAFSIVANYSGMTDNMRNLLSSCIHLMLEMDGGSMQELHRLMDDTRNGDLVARGTELRNRYHRDFFRNDFLKKKYTVTKDALATRLSGLLSSEALYDIVSGESTFSIPHAFNTPGLYLFNLGKGVIGETAGSMLGRIILAQLQAAAFKRERDGLTEQKVPTKNYVFIDEFQNFVSQTTGTIVAEARKYGLSLILIQQYVGQGIDADLMQNILTNTPLKITGVGTLSTYEKVTASQHIEREGFDGLRPRLFHVSRRGGQPFVTEAHGFLAGRQERMTREEQTAFARGQLARYYRPSRPSRTDAPEGRGEASGVEVVPNIPPDEFTPPRASERVQKGGGGIAAVRQALGIRKVRAPLRQGDKRQTPPVPSPTPSLPAAPPPPVAAAKEPDGDYLPEEEMTPGVFHSRRKPKFKAP